ncbi:MAG: D-alanyl-D-alanine carboxypeptidase family protein [Oscillospiraceae bacterium]
MKYAKFLGIAAAVLLCGCTNTQLHNMDSSSGISTSPTSSSGNKSGDGVNSSTIGKTECTISEKSTISTNDTFDVFDGDNIFIENGGELTVDGKMTSEKGGKVIIENGGVLILNSEAQLDCDLTVEKGGKLIVGENGKVSGSGSITVVDSFDDIECSGSVTAKIVPPAPVTENGVTRVGGVLIVNKKYSIPSDFGSELITDDEAGTGLIRDEAYDALCEMREASGYTMSIVSGFRSYRTQTAIYNRNVANYGEEEANSWSAKPGESEHQTGLAIDITSLEQSYGDTEEGQWLAENCHKFGFIIRFQKEKEAITGYIYEPWHVRYLGESTARLVHDSGLALEEFLGVD